MIHEKIISRNTILESSDAKTQVIRTDKGYYLAMTTKESFTFKKITKKSHDLMIKSMGEKVE